VIKKLKANSYRLKAFVYKGLIIELRLGVPEFSHAAAKNRKLAVKAMNVVFIDLV
jgi:hypothetical protein